MITWEQIYRKEIERAGGHKSFLELKINEKKPLIESIIKLACYNRRILEAGCGTAVISTYLSILGYEVTAIDIDENMLNLGKEFSRFSSNPPVLKKESLFELNYEEDFFDIVFSNGVLEHFSDRDIEQIVNNELRISKSVIVSVPSDYYGEGDRMYGDERFMGLEKWKDIFNATNGRVVDKFGYYFQSRLTKALNIIISRVMIKYAPYLAFVIRKN